MASAKGQEENPTWSEGDTQEQSRDPEILLDIFHSWNGEQHAMRAQYAHVSMGHVLFVCSGTPGSSLAVLPFCDCINFVEGCCELSIHTTAAS